MSQPKSNEELMTEFDIQQRLFLAGKLHSTKWNVWFKDVLAQKDKEVAELQEEIDWVVSEVAELGDKPWRLFATLRKLVEKYRPDYGFAIEWAQRWKIASSNGLIKKVVQDSNKEIQEFLTPKE